ncbi:uncharacterized protein LOC124885807 [Capsicum annuum]|uniref:uncharacterized protein LOC124885807 n=1 Tax=Capsicum annuum TaxID=4072 RepID=UPI001FB08876|nr:uncharacterized protein LOC124885807 [Capsicum annuum]
MGGSSVNVISAYALKVGLDKEKKKEFWEVLDGVVKSISSTEKLFVGGDFNGHIRSLLRGCIREIARELLGVSRGRSSKYRGDWWWNEEVKRKVDSKKVAYDKLVGSKDDEERQKNKEEYNVARREAKLTVTTAKIVAFKSLYLVLEEKGRDKKLYRMAKARERRARDLYQVNYIKEEDGIVLGKDALIREM